MAQSTRGWDRGLANDFNDTTFVRAFVSAAHRTDDQSILNIRGHRVMVDADLADLYGVTTK